MAVLDNEIVSVYEDDNIIVRPSPIEGLGSFTKRPFKKGEVVFVWHPKVLTKEEVETLPEDQKRYFDTRADGTPILMQIPERYVNWATDPNTVLDGESDVALRDIAAGEEITSAYPID
ncbi:MAG: SET domain-containing protein-lysine N-methyltransferase [Candidatus Paceibacterota bacterium]